MFTYVVVEPDQNSPHELECSYTDCDIVMPFQDTHKWTFINPQTGKRVYMAYCSHRCALKSFNHQVLWRA